MTEEEITERRRLPCPRRRPLRRLLPEALCFFAIVFCNLWFLLLLLWLGPFPHTQPQPGPRIPLRMTWSRFIAALFVLSQKIGAVNYFFCKIFSYRAVGGAAVGSQKTAACGRRRRRAARARVRSGQVQEPKNILTSAWIKFFNDAFKSMSEC